MAGKASRGVEVTNPWSRFVSRLLDRRAVYAFLETVSVEIDCSGSSFSGFRSVSSCVESQFFECQQRFGKSLFYHHVQLRIGTSGVKRISYSNCRLSHYWFSYNA